MLTGNFLLAASAVTLIFSTLKKEYPRKNLVLISTALTICASLYLWFLIFSNDFSVEYVAAYSSTTLPPMYKISAFWAGQQGSFLFWLLVHSIVGTILISKKTSAESLKFYFALELILIIFVLEKSPFAANPVTVSEGVGLNPLLQDFWMAIHPPVIFVGYALLAVPLSLSLGTLINSAASRNWLEPARVWTLTAFGFLGAGIFIGGYWAYKVLGWGGYWAWDPVENSSLVPFLLAAVLLHLINLAKKKTAVLPMAHIAAVFTYSLVIYGTFLTRSGILGDFSVHSFAGSEIGLTIALANALILIGGLLIIFFKAKNFPAGKMYENFSEQSFIVLLSCLLIIFMAVIVWLGMSMPLLTKFLDNPAAVDESFYVKSTAPIAAVLVVLLIYTFAKFKVSFGGKITHAGFILMLAAIVISSSGETVTAELSNGVETEIAGHKIIYGGQIIEDRQKFYIYKVDGEEVRALTKLRGNGEDAAREPAILKNFSGDIYIAPHPPQNIIAQELILEKNKFAMDGELGYTFLDAEIIYDAENKPARATAIIEITDGVTTEKIQPLITVTADGGTSSAIEIFDGRRRVRLTGISGDLQKARLEILPTIQEISAVPITTTISTKPFIWLLWLSVTAICAGTFLAVKKF
mgnify:CR=1 FL=1